MNAGRGLIIIIALAALDSHAQIATGGTFSLSQSVVAGGGRTSSSGAFTVEGTTAQTSAGGPLQSGTFSIYSGFWHPATLSPTAAGVSISGRVLTTDGRGMRSAIITLSGPDGAPRNALSSSLGYYTFDQVPAGQTYILTVSSNRYTFAQPVIIVHAVDSLEDVNFIGELCCPTDQLIF